MGAQRAAEIEPGSILQQHVEHDEVMRLPGKRLVHLRTAFGRRNLKALRREIARKELPDLQIVVDDQDVRVAIQAWPHRYWTPCRHRDPRKHSEMFRQTTATRLLLNDAAAYGTISRGAASPDGGHAMQLIRSDLDFILAQIMQAETNAPIADPSLPVGLARG